jgi:hypothetical protein
MRQELIEQMVCLLHRRDHRNAYVVGHRMTWKEVAYARGVLKDMEDHETDMFVQDPRASARLNRSRTRRRLIIRGTSS